MKAIPLTIPDIILFEPKVFGDDRGFFFESFNQHNFEEIAGISPTFVQDNHSKSTKRYLILHTSVNFQNSIPKSKLKPMQKRNINGKYQKGKNALCPFLIKINYV